MKIGKKEGNKGKKIKKELAHQKVPDEIEHGYLPLSVDTNILSSKICVKNDGVQNGHGFLEIKLGKEEGWLV